MHRFDDYGRRLAVIAGCFAFATLAASASPTSGTAARPFVSNFAVHPATTHTYKVVYQVPSGLFIGNLVGLNGNLIGPATTTTGPYPHTKSLVEITPTGQARTIHTFGGDYGEADWLTADNSKNTLYGVSRIGAHADGFVFSKVPGGVYKHIYDFPYQGPAGAPNGPVLDLNGTLYGTCDAGVYTISPSGTFTLIAFPTFPSSYQQPYGNLVELNGSIYALRQFETDGYWGSVLAISPPGVITTIYSYPYSGGYATYLNDLVLSNGLFYGVSEIGYAYGYPGTGIVFQLNPTTGQLTTIADVSSYTDGVSEGYPNGLTLVNGSFYGTTQNLIYEVNPTGTYSVLHTFADPADNYPGIFETLAFSNGLLYGTANDTNSNESVFSVAP